jgi:predicted secreted hydrolase
MSCFRSNPWVLILLLFFPAALPGQPPAGVGGYAVPQPGHRFSFPLDYGAHPDFRIEWWYVTGHLFGDDGGRFGFQATFFRLGGPRGGAEADVNFSHGEVLLAHMALTDAATGKFWHEERLNRGGWDAHAAAGDLDLRNGEWSMRRTDGPGPAFELHGGVEAEVSFDLSLAAKKPLVVFGENGVSRKGEDSAAASYYLTFSRLAAQGKLTVGGTPFSVHGEAWMDHEISSSQLGRGQVGWDWICVQFRHEPRELMLYRMRRADGTADPVSRLQWVTPEGRPVTAGFSWEVDSHWKSPRSGATYPSRVRLTTKDPDSGAPVALEIEPLVADQELVNTLGGGPYWEGACRVRNAQGEDIGSAYMELTGYAKALKF